MRGAFRIKIAICRIQHRAIKQLLIKQRIKLLSITERKQLSFKVEVSRPRMGHFQPFHAFFGVGQKQAARTM